MPVAAFRHPYHWLVILVLIALASGLYLPFIGNPLVYDDWTLFSGRGFAYYATHPFSLFRIRNLPNFSLALPYVLGAGFTTQRIISLVFHLACAVAFYRLLQDLLQVGKQLKSTQKTEHRDIVALSLIGATAFAIHPVAVYGAGYLMQRTILLATLFSLLSIILLLRGLRRGSHGDAISAALMYSLAVYSKEHSILLPAVAVAAAYYAGSRTRFTLRHCGLYLAACAPAAILLVLLQKQVIGHAYEPHIGAVASQLGSVFGLDVVNMSWSRSAVTQAGLFFKYLYLWIWPDVNLMSADLRVDFSEHWSTGWIILKTGAFAAFGILGAALLLRGGRPGLIGFGMLFSWVLFVVELSVSRFQEPFVLYRSYLWAPGILIALVAILSMLPRRAVAAICLLACPILFVQAHDRLTSFSSEYALWEDAVEKLPEKPVSWGSRTLFNFARESSYRGKTQQADALVERCMSQYPDNYHCLYARGAILYGQGDYEAAVPNLNRAIELNAQADSAYEFLASALERTGRIDEALVVLHIALERGSYVAKSKIERIEKLRQDDRVLPPG